MCFLVLVVGVVSLIPKRITLLIHLLSQHLLNPMLKIRQFHVILSSCPGYKAEGFIRKIADEVGHNQLFTIHYSLKTIIPASPIFSFESHLKQK